jgi:hypothetical protein
MGEPSGKIVGRPMVARACGHKQEFQEYEIDRYRAQRLAKFQKTRCADCVAKLNEEQRQAAQALPKKGEALQRLPTGTQVFLMRQPDGSWSGRLSAGGTVVEATGTPEAGPHSVVVTLARLWASKTGGGPE